MIFDLIKPGIMKIAAIHGHELTDEEYEKFCAKYNIFSLCEQNEYQRLVLLFTEDVMADRKIADGPD